MPRFIITMREMYDREGRGCRQGVDTAFGASSQPVADTDTFVSAIAFAGGNPGQEGGQTVEDDARDSETIQLEVLKDGARQV